MKYLFTVLRPVILGATRHPLLVLLMAAVLTVGSVLMARNLVIDPDLPT